MSAPVEPALHELSEAEARRSQASNQALELWDDQVQRRFWAQVLTQIDAAARQYQQDLQTLNQQLAQALRAIQ